MNPDGRQRLKDHDHDPDAAPARYLPATSGTDPTSRWSMGPGSWRRPFSSLLALSSARFVGRRAVKADGDGHGLPAGGGAALSGATRMRGTNLGVRAA
jgi:hypothetical protein